jgi:hypothetical protein
LAGAETDEERTQTDLERKVRRLKLKGAKAGIWYPVEAENRRSHRRLEAIIAVRELVNEEVALPKVKGISAAPPSESAGRQRSDRMALEIDAAIEALTVKATATQVMAWLIQQADKEGSCIVSGAPDGVIWADALQSPQKLRLKALQKRLKRRLSPAKVPPRPH